MTGKPSREEMAARGRLGGYARAAKLTPEELSAQNTRAVNIRHARERERRAAEGLPPSKPRPKPLTDEEMTYWKSVVDERFPNHVWENRMQRSRMAVRLAREAAARAAAEAFRRARADRGDA